MTAELNLNGLLKFLNEKDLKPALESEKGQIYIKSVIRDREVPTFFGIISEGLILQLVTYLPFMMQTETVSELARLLHYLNREIDMPGFGMDEKNGFIFYRLVMPSLDKTFNEKLLELYIGTSKMICETFIDAIDKVLKGTSNVDDLAKQPKSPSA